MYFLMHHIGWHPMSGCPMIVDAEFLYMVKVVSTTSPHHKRIFPPWQLASNLWANVLEPAKILLTFHPKV